MWKNVEKCGKMWKNVEKRQKRIEHFWLKVILSKVFFLLFFTPLKMRINNSYNDLNLYII